MEEERKEEDRNLKNGGFNASLMSHTHEHGGISINSGGCYTWHRFGGRSPTLSMSRIAWNRYYLEALDGDIPLLIITSRDLFKIDLR